MRFIRGFFISIVSVIALAPLPSGAVPGAGLAGTPHDFSGIGGTPTGLCTFCHTPHKAQSQALLWNHTLSVNTFSWSDPSTTAGTQYATFQGDTYRGVSSRCLSCHDGSVAVGDIGWWNGGPPGVLLNIFHDSGFANIASPAGDLTGNHPVAMPYPYNNVANTYNGVTTGNAAILSEWQADPTGLGIRLFHDDGAGNITAGPLAGQTGIECSSCHDPHNGAGVIGDYFLRGTLGGNTTDYICLKCHIK